MGARAPVPARRGDDRLGHRQRRSRAVLADAGTLAPGAPEMLRRILSSRDARDLAAAGHQAHRTRALDDAVYPSPARVAERRARWRTPDPRRIAGALGTAGIATTGQRGYHLIWCLANERCAAAARSRAREQRSRCSTSGSRTPVRRLDRDETLAPVHGVRTGHGSDDGAGLRVVDGWLMPATRAWRRRSGAARRSTPSDTVAADALGF